MRVTFPQSFDLGFSAGRQIGHAEARARIQAIIDSPEAGAIPHAAAKLALETPLSVADALTVLREMVAPLPCKGRAA